MLTALVIPVLVRAEMEDKDRGQAFFERLFTLSLTILGIALVVSLALSPVLVGILVGDSKVDEGLTQALVIMFLPQLVFFGLSALFTAMLNTRDAFKPGAWAPVACNTVQIATLVTFYLMPGELTLNPTQMGQPKLLVLGIGSTLGVILQAMIQVPAMRRAGIKLRLRWGWTTGSNTSGRWASRSSPTCSSRWPAGTRSHRSSRTRPTAGPRSTSTPGWCCNCRTA
ncbi:hypothetical protein MTP03_47890 [Tsukamurella sp. PLM1]|nr:hypothetical protein MTP03_47890 [Tsukamurella sp. PLM1]